MLYTLVRLELLPLPLSLPLLPATGATAEGLLRGVRLFLVALISGHTFVASSNIALRLAGISAPLFHSPCLQPRSS